MNRVYAIHDDAEDFVGDPCLLDEKSYGYIIAVINNEDYEADIVGDPDTNPLKVFLVYNYNEDDIGCTASVTPVTYVTAEMEREVADRIGISLTVNALEARIAKQPSPYYWNDPDKSQLGIIQWLEAVMNRIEMAQKCITGKITEGRIKETIFDENDSKKEIIDAILGLVIAYNRVLQWERTK